jgi:hypothetical protein
VQSCVYIMDEEVRNLATVRCLGRRVCGDGWQDFLWCRR